MKITNTEFNVLKVMAEKDIDWTWMIPDRTLATRGIPGFSNVANIVTNLVNEGMVDAVYNENSSRPRYRVSEQGHQLLGKSMRLQGITISHDFFATPGSMTKVKRHRNAYVIHLYFDIFPLLRSKKNVQQGIVNRLYVLFMNTVARIYKLMPALLLEFVPTHR